MEIMHRHVRQLQMEGKMVCTKGRWSLLQILYYHGVHAMKKFEYTCIRKLSLEPNSFVCQKTEIFYIWKYVCYQRSQSNTELNHMLKFSHVPSSVRTQKHTYACVNHIRKRDKWSFPLDNRSKVQVH